MTEFCCILSSVVTAGAGVGGNTVCGTVSGSGNAKVIVVYVIIGVLAATLGAGAFNVVVTGSSLAGLGVAVATGAGEGGVAVLGTGGIGNGGCVGVTGCSLAVYGVGVTARAGIGGVACLGAGRSYSIGDVVVYVLAITAFDLGLNVEGEVVLVGVTCGVGAPVVLGGVPLEVGVTAYVLHKEGAVASVGESPGLIHTGIVEGGIGSCKSDNLAGKRGEGICAVIVYGNYEDLSIGYVRKIICGVVNALVVVRGCVNLFSGKELAVSGSADENEIAVLKLGGKNPGGNSGGDVFLTAGAFTVDEGVSGSGYGGLLGGNGVTYRALYTFGKTGLGAGRSYSLKSYVVLVSAESTLGSITYRAGLGSLAGCLGPGVAESLALSSAALTGLGSGAGCVSKCVFVCRCLLGGSLYHGLILLAGGEAEGGKTDHKQQEQCDS